MNRREIIGMIGLSAAAEAASAVRERFIGVWGLVSCERKYKDGRKEYPYGEKPEGRITYDKAGRMSALLMRPGRPSTIRPGVADIRDAVTGFMAYYGKFDVDEASNTVIHHVQCCVLPSWVGTDLKRTYRFDSNRLLLSVLYPDSSTELVWERQPD